VAALAAEHFVIVLAGRDPGKARALLDELAPGGEHHAIDLAHFADLTDFPFDDRAGCLDLIVNASPLGMAGQPALKFDLSHAPPGSVVYAIVTHPLETPWLQLARAEGFRTVDGLSMLVGQAAVAFEHLVGRPPAGAGGRRGLRAVLGAWASRSSSAAPGRWGWASPRSLRCAPNLACPCSTPMPSSGTCRGRRERLSPKLRPHSPAAPARPELIVAASARRCSAIHRRSNGSKRSSIRLFARRAASSCAPMPTRSWWCSTYRCCSRKAASRKWTRRSSCRRRRKRSGNGFCRVQA